MFEERSDEFALPARNALRSNADEETRKGDFLFWLAIGEWGVFWGATPFGQANGVAKTIDATRHRRCKKITKINKRNLKIPKTSKTTLLEIISPLDTL